MVSPKFTNAAAIVLVLLVFAAALGMFFIAGGAMNPTGITGPKSDQSPPS